MTSVKNIFIFLSFLLITSCNNNKKLPAPADTVALLQQMQELATVEYTITKVVKASDDKTWFKIGNRKILITCEATVKAGIDLKELKEENISVSGKTITIQLPEPKILSVNMPPENIKVAYQKVDLFRDAFTSGERNALLVQAEQQIKNAGTELGAVEQAKINSQLVFSRLLMQLGFEKVNLTYNNASHNGRE